MKNCFIDIKTDIKKLQILKFYAQLPLYFATSNKVALTPLENV